MKNSCIPFRDYDFYTDDDSDDDVKQDMDAMLSMNPITKERLRFIPNTHTYANSVNVYVGRPRSGKSYSAIYDIIKIVRNDPNVHLLVYVNQKGECDDDTFERFQSLIECPIIFVKYDQCEEYLKTLLDYKGLYNKIKDNQAESRVPQEVKDEMFEFLQIDDFDRDYLHTLIMTEDATNTKQLKNTNSFINDLLTRCAHTQFSFFILIHYWKALTTNIKANLSTIYIYGGYSRQQLNYMLYQMNIPITTKELFSKYQRMPQYSKLMIDCNLGNYAIL